MSLWIIKRMLSTWLSIKTRDYERIQIFSFSIVFFLFSIMNKTRTGSFLCYGKIYTVKNASRHSLVMQFLMMETFAIGHIVNFWRARSNFQLFYWSFSLWIYVLCFGICWRFSGINYGKKYFYSCKKIFFN